MGSLGQGPPVAEERDSSRMIIGLAVLVVIAGALAAAFLLREPPKTAKTASPYIASLKLSDFKMSAAENFIGATVSYVDGSVTNSGDKTVTHAVVEVVFKDALGQMAQREELPLRVAQDQRSLPGRGRSCVVAAATGADGTFSPDIRQHLGAVEPPVSGDAGHGCGGEVSDPRGSGQRLMPTRIRL